MIRSIRSLSGSVAAGLLATHLAATAFMAGVIWFVQIVHYPLMDGWPHADFSRWEAAHRERTAMVVIPAMLLEGGAATLLLAVRPRGVPGWLVWAGWLALLGIWASTFAVQVPLHDELSAGWHAPAHARLVSTNWLRTLLWSIRTLLAVAMLPAAWRPAPGSGPTADSTATPAAETVLR